MRAVLELGQQDLAGIITHAGESTTWRFIATDEGLELWWDNGPLYLFFAWDEYHSSTSTPQALPPEAPKKWVVKSVDETETLPGLDDDIRRWTDEAADE